MSAPPFSIAGKTHAGRARPTNEDHVLVDEMRGLVVVADGIGGELAGELAARAACDAIRDAPAKAASGAPFLESAMAGAASRVLEMARGSSGADRMGTTVAALRLDASGRAEIAHVGDVRVYVLRGARATMLRAAAPRYCPVAQRPSGAAMSCVTRDHTSICELVERGHVEPAAARRHPLRGRVNRVLGRHDVDRADLLQLELAPGDRLLVCTDGLWGQIDDELTARLLEDMPTPQAACDALVAAALEAGGEDNIGVAVVHWPPGSRPEAATEAVDRVTPLGPLGGLLGRLGRDLTLAAARGELDPVIGRDGQLRELARALVQRRKSNALLIGEPGVGKTSMVEALAQRIVGVNPSPELSGLRVIELSANELVAGTKYRGELEERLEQLLREAEEDRSIVLFIDEIHMFVAGSAESNSMALGNALKPALARGRIRVIGATTTVEYERHMAKDEAFTRRFEIIQVVEPSPEETLAMLRGLRAKLDAHYRVVLGEDALTAAVELSTRFMPDRRLPDKAVDLVDRACARLVLRSLSRHDSGSDDRVVGREQIALAVAERCRLPLELVAKGERGILRDLEDGLGRRIKGQGEAISAISSAIRRAHAGLRDPERPVASFLFVGPTGVGKTETARALAELVIGRRDALVKIDMSEYAERHSVSRLIGAPPGYIGHDQDGQLTGAVRRQPACVVLLDEIEKAHPDVLLVLLQVLEDGVLTDARGRKATFHESIVVMTSNLPLDEPASRRVAGFHQVDTPAANLPSAQAEADADRRRALVRHLRPELVGRIGAIVPFRALSARDVQEIVELAVANIERRLAGQGVTLPGGASVRASVLARVGALDLGARQVERIAEEECGRALEQAVVDAPRQRILLDSLRASSVVAMLVVDMVGSTRFLAELGETQFTSAVRRLIETVRCHETAEDLRFLKCTGDGLFALYGGVASAFDAALAVAGAFAGAPSAPLLRRVVHFGRVRHGPDDEPLGVEVHRIFRMEAIAAEDRVASPDGFVMPTAPLMTSRAARDELDEGRRHNLRVAGVYRLAGFVEPVEIWCHDERKGEPR